MAYDARLALARQAERSLDLQYFLVKNDPAMQTLFDAIAESAARGVRVRLLLDDLSAANHDFALARFSKLPNVQVRVFNPFPAGRATLITRYLFSINHLSRLTQRMHNKLFVADNALAIVGGRNLSGEYFNESEDLNFVDLDVLVAGPAVPSMSAVFDRYWNDDLAYPIETLVDGTKTADVQPPLEGGTAKTVAPQETRLSFDIADMDLVGARVRALADKPDKVEMEGVPEDEAIIFDDVVTIMSRAQQEVLIISPYIIPSESVLRLFTELAARGVSVRVLTNSLSSTDMLPAHAAYARHRRKILDSGTELYELQGSPRETGGEITISGVSSNCLHVKSVVVDRRILFIGSMNLDPLSENQNTENGVVIASRELANQLAELFATVTAPENSYHVRLAEDGKTIVWMGQGPEGLQHYSVEPETTLWRRLITPIYGAVLPEYLL